MHLHIAEQIYELAAQNGNSKGDGRLKEILTVEWPAFYLGSVAPDVNAISDIPRFGTHFYEVPPPEEEMAYPTMLSTFPQLANCAAMPPAQALFVAAYSAHLLLDLIWLRQIVYPFFFAPRGLGSRKQRTLIHNILLTYLDTLALAALPETAVSTLAAATPNQWLPFVPDAILVEWRDILTAQLAPDAPVRTVEIYAGRMKMLPDEFVTNLQDPIWMQTQVFDKIPVAEVQAILDTAVPQSLELVQNFLQLPA